MRFSDILNAVYLDIRADSKRQLLKHLTYKAATALSIEPDALFTQLMDVEKTVTSGIGEGLAIPHVKAADISSPYGLFARTAAPVEFDAVDDRPVDLVYMLISPNDSSPDYLRHLAKVSRLLRDRSLCEKLRGADNDNVVRSLISEKSATVAA